MSNALAYAVVVVMVGYWLAFLRRDVRLLVSARSMWLVTLLVWFLLEAIQMPKEILRFSQEQYNLGVLCVLLSFLGFVAGYHRIRLTIFDSFAMRLGVLDTHQLLWRLFITGCLLGLVPLLVISGFDLAEVFLSSFTRGRRWSSPFSRGRYGGIREAFLQLQMFLIAVTPIAVVLMLSVRHTLVKRVIAGLFMIWILARSMRGGTRSSIVPTIGPLLAALYFWLRPSQKKMALLIGLPLLALIGYTWSAATVVTRNTGEFRWSAADDVDYVGFEMFRELLFISSKVPDELEYRLGRTYYVQLVNPIPRFLWPDKPTDDAGLVLATARGEVDASGEAYLTRSPGLLGEMYWNFGIPGVFLLSALAGVLLRAWDRIPQLAPDSRCAFLIYTGGLGLVFLSGRSISMPTYYGLISFTVLLWVLIRAPRLSSNMTGMQPALARGYSPKG
jgi:hypothetical protein